MTTVPTTNSGPIKLNRSNLTFQINSAEPTKCKVLDGNGQEISLISKAVYNVDPATGFAVLTLEVLNPKVEII